jgi:hypothetical protein
VVGKRSLTSESIRPDPAPESAGQRRLAELGSFRKPGVPRHDSRAHPASNRQVNPHSELGSFRQPGVPRPDSRAHPAPQTPTDNPQGSDNQTPPPRVAPQSFQANWLRFAECRSHLTNGANPLETVHIVHKMHKDQPPAGCPLTG